jgi:CRISPR/Cas system-associated protein Cas10 (large subunit of type III CRISPR-Cas system)
LNPGARLHRPGNIDDLLVKFYDFCKVDLSLVESTAKDYRRKMRRFLEATNRARFATRSRSQSNACTWLKSPNS